MALYSQLESARSLAAAGDFRAGRASYASVEAGLRSAAAAAAHDPSATQAWADLLGQLREERELLAAFESECAELEALAAEQVRGRGTVAPALLPAGVQAWHATYHTLRTTSLPPIRPHPHPLQPPPLDRPSAPSGNDPPAGAAQAFHVDLRSFQCQELPPRPQQHATPPAPQRDPDVWPAADPAAATPPLGSGYKARDGSWRERGEAYERVRRESLTPGGGSGGSGL